VQKICAVLTGFEPATPALTGRRCSAAEWGLVPLTCGYCSIMAALGAYVGADGGSSAEFLLTPPPLRPELSPVRVDSASHAHGWPGSVLLGCCRLARLLYSAAVW